MHRVSLKGNMLSFVSTEIRYSVSYRSLGHLVDTCYWSFDGILIPSFLQLPLELISLQAKHWHRAREREKGKNFMISKRKSQTACYETRLWRSCFMFYSLKSIKIRTERHELCSRGLSSGMSNFSCTIARQSTFDLAYLPISCMSLLVCTSAVRRADSTSRIFACLSCLCDNLIERPIE